MFLGILPATSSLLPISRIPNRYCNDIGRNIYFYFANYFYLLQLFIHELWKNINKANIQESLNIEAKLILWCFSAFLYAIA